MDNNIMLKITDYKLQLVLNRSLFNDNIISVDVYREVDSSLRKKISSLSEKLQLV